MAAAIIAIRKSMEETTVEVGTEEHRKITENMRSMIPAKEHREAEFFLGVLVLGSDISLIFQSSWTYAAILLS